MCAKITQYSRISHHTISGSASAGLTFSVPAQEDFTDGSWTPFDLALSEIGVNEEDKKVYIRIDDHILELGTIGGSSSLGVTPSLSQVLAVDNQTLGNDIEITNGDLIQGDYIQIVGGGLGPFGSSIEIRHIDPIYPLDYVGIFIDDKKTSIHYLEDSITPGEYSLNGIFLGTPQIEKNNNISISKIVVEADFIENKVFDTTNTYLTQILSTTQSTLINTEDLFTPKQGKLEVHRDFCYFGHLDSSTGDFSSIQSQDDTINLTAQNGGGENSIQTITPQYFDITNTDTSFITPKFSQFRLDSTSIIHNSGDRYAAEPVVYKLSSKNTTNALTQSLAAIDVSGFSGSVITIAGIVTAFGSTNSKAYGANLFATFKYFGGTLTQISTTDKSEKTDFSTATSDINASGTDIRIRVTGEASTDMYWWSRYNYEIVKI